MPIDKESWYIYAKDQGISDAKAKEYWNRAKESVDKNQDAFTEDDWQKVFSVFKIIIKNSKSKQESYMSRIDYALQEGSINKELWNEFTSGLSGKPIDKKTLSYIRSAYVIYDGDDDEGMVQFADLVIYPFIEFYIQNSKKYDTIEDIIKDFKKSFKIKEKKDTTDEDKRLAPFIGYAENNGIDADKAKAIFYSARSELSKEEDQPGDNLGPKQMGMLWGKYKDAIEDAGGTRDKKGDDKKESFITTKAYIVEGYCIKKDSNVLLEFKNSPLSVTSTSTLDSIEELDTLITTIAKENNIPLEDVKYITNYIEDLKSEVGQIDISAEELKALALDIYTDVSTLEKKI